MVTGGWDSDFMAVLKSPRMIFPAAVNSLFIMKKASYLLIGSAGSSWAREIIFLCSGPAIQSIRPYHRGRGRCMFNRHRSVVIAMLALVSGFAVFNFSDYFIAFWITTSDWLHLTKLMYLLNIQKVVKVWGKFFSALPWPLAPASTTTKGRNKGFTIVITL